MSLSGALDLRSQYRRSGPAPRVAVVGAGLAGLFCARTLSDRGFAVRVFDKGRGVGGRMSTRRNRLGVFDHGAQYFTVRDERFGRYVASWREQGIVAEWTGRLGAAAGEAIEPKDDGPIRYAGVGGMNRICRRLAVELDVAVNTRIDRVRRVDGGWTLSAGDEAFSSFDWVVAALPPSQAAALLEDASGIASQARTVRMRPCWAVLAAFEQPALAGYDGLFINQGPLSWIARNNSKAGQALAFDCWTLHGSPDWSQEHLEEPPDSVCEALVAAFRSIVGSRVRLAGPPTAHRWRFALADEPLASGCLLDRSEQAGICGDWCQGSRVEGAFLSGMAMAERLLGVL